MTNSTSATQLPLDLSQEIPRTESPKGIDSKIRIEHLFHSYGEQRVLKGISFKVRPGEVLGILGPNGAGKTTIFQILAGLLPPESGEFYLEGKPYNPIDPAARDQLGIVFQNPSLDQKLSARENLLLSAALYRVPKKEAQQRAEQLLRFMELDDRADDLVQKFSGGMKRRLEIVRALIAGPSLLILDEPTTGLDEAGFQKIWQRLLDLKDKTGLTMLLTTHRADEAEKCDRLVVLNDGVIVADDTPESLKHHVGGDILQLEVSSEELIPEIVKDLKEKLELDAKVVENNKLKIIAAGKKGHVLVPKIVEEFEKNTFLSVALYRPSIADVFMQLTGNLLSNDVKKKKDENEKERR